MLRPWVFLIAVAAYLCLVVAAHRPLPSDDLFSASSLSSDFDGFTFAEMWQAKLTHGLESKPYDIGLFGNSRSVMVGADDLDAPGSFFNFSVPGGSIRSSVLMLETLSRAGRAPRLALVQFDHAELQYYGLAQFGDAPGRAREMLRDLSADVPLRDRLRMAVRHAYFAGEDLAGLIKFAHVKRGLDWWMERWHGRDPWRSSSGGTRYRRDGSRITKPAIQPAMPLPRQAAGVLSAYIDADMGRLAATGVPAVVYESALDRVGASLLLSRPSAFALRTRAAWLAACRRHEVPCQAFEAGRFSYQGSNWEDATHPPSRELAAYLRDILVAATPATRPGNRTVERR